MSQYYISSQYCVFLAIVYDILSVLDNIFRSWQGNPQWIPGCRVSISLNTDIIITITFTLITIIITTNNNITTITTRYLHHLHCPMSHALWSCCDHLNVERMYHHTIYFLVFFAYLENIYIFSCLYLYLCIWKMYSGVHVALNFLHHLLSCQARAFHCFPWHTVAHCTLKVVTLHTIKCALILIQNYLYRKKRQHRWWSTELVTLCKRWIFSYICQPENGIFFVI